MPYKNPKDRKLNKRLWRQANQLLRFRAMGFEPVDMNPEAPLECQTCLKVTARNCPHMWRHESWCPEIAKLPRQPRKWSRQRVTA